MSTLEGTRTQVPTGTWKSDPTHSSIDFTVKHMVVSSFRGSLPRFEATLEVDENGAVLTGTGQVESIVAADDNLTAHLRSPEFFDAERYPELTFRSTSIVRDGDVLTVEGELTVKGITKTVSATGEISGPVSDPYGSDRLGLELSTSFDRRDFGLDWNAPMPGGGLVLSNVVNLTAHLELKRS